MRLRSVSQNVALLNILVHDMINSLYYDQLTDKRKYFYVCTFRYRYSLVSRVFPRAKNPVVCAEFPMGSKFHLFQ